MLEQKVGSPLLATKLHRFNRSENKLSTTLSLVLNSELRISPEIANGLWHQRFKCKSVTEHYIVVTKEQLFSCTVS